MLALNAQGQIESAETPADHIRLFAENGHASAQNQLADMYANGNGVTRDRAKSLTWYRAAAFQGFTPAQFTLGLIYAEGDGVPKDEIEAFVWFELAARAGDVEAARNRTIARSHIGPIDIATAQAKIEALSRAITARTKKP
jgi:TPR repeat protein